MPRTKKSLSIGTAKARRQAARIRKPVIKGMRMTF